MAEIGSILQPSLHAVYEAILKHVKAESAVMDKALRSNLDGAAALSAHLKCVADALDRSLNQASAATNRIENEVRSALKAVRDGLKSAIGTSKDGSNKAKGSSLSFTNLFTSAPTKTESNSIVKPDDRVLQQLQKLNTALQGTTFDIRNLSDAISKAGGLAAETKLQYLEVDLSGFPTDLLKSAETVTLLSFQISMDIHQCHVHRC